MLDRPPSVQYEAGSMPTMNFLGKSCPGNEVVGASKELVITRKPTVSERIHKNKTTKILILI